ncbi:hypothetical protein FXF51_47530 [Nonomuraea sp. PA05]|nr:hypothetical protein FXF51_47530 [Nonomuraea sp. PA05]
MAGLVEGRVRGGTGSWRDGPAGGWTGWVGGGLSRWRAGSAGVVGSVRAPVTTTPAPGAVR